MSSITNIAISYSELIVATIFLSTVWLYLFALPFQLVDLFGWYTIPGVGIASFIYLGFIATGEEIEQHTHALLNLIERKIHGKKVGLKN